LYRPKGRAGSCTFHAFFCTKQQIATDEQPELKAHAAGTLGMGHAITPHRSLA
jgi:hypothetical protein